MLLKYLRIITLLFISVFIFACNSNKINKQIKNDTDIVATIGEDTINLFEIDSTVAQQIYNIRMQYLEVLISRKTLQIEAKKQNVKLEELVKNKIDILAEKVNNIDISNYIRREKITYVDTVSIVQYLTLIKQKQRQEEYTDSLKEHLDINVLLIPPFFKEIDTSGIYYHNLNNTKADNIVYIISDYKCLSCRKAESKVKKLIANFKDNVEFRFVYHSSYIDKPALAIEAAKKQDAFIKMHNKLFEIDLFKNDTIYTEIAKELGLDIAKFNKDMNNSNILKKLTKNRELLISKDVYSTPTFIVNTKLLDGKYAIDYLEKVMENELN